MAINQIDFIQKIESKVKCIIDSSDNKSINIIIEHLSYLVSECKMTLDSTKNKQLQYETKKKNNNKPTPHPIQVERGCIYNAQITAGVGSELKGNHLVIIIQNKNGNIFAEKVNAVVIEGDGNKINPKYQIQLSNVDLTDGSLNKDPSRVIPTEVITIDKARIGRYVGRISPEKMKEIDMKIISKLSFEKYIKKH